MATLGQAYVQIVPSADGISNSISSVLSGPADTAGQEAGSKFGSSFGDKMKNGLMIAGAGIAAFGATAGVALGKSISDVSKYGDHVDKMSQKIGFSAEGFQKWDYVLNRAGTSIDSMAPVMKTLSNAAVSNSDAFQKLGISQEEVANMSQEELFGKTIEALSGMEEGAERTALASKLLGRGASELAPLINGGTDAIEEQMKMAEDYGMVMSDEGVKASADFVDAQTTLQGTLTGLKNKVTADFLPAATDVVNGLAQMASGDFMGGFDLIKEGVGEFIGNIASKVPEMITKGGEMLAGFIQGLTEKIPEMATAAAEAIRNFAQGFGQNSEGGSEMLAKASELMLALGQALMDAAGVIFPALIEAIWAFFSNTDWLGLSLTVAQNLFDGFLTILPQAIDFIGNFVANVLDIFGFHGLAEQVRGIFEDIKSKITQPIEDAKNVVDSAISKIKGFFPISVGKILDNIKLPHFTVDGGEAPYGLMGKGYPPSFDVSWNAKGGIFDGASIIGVGEAGPEAVIPLSSDRMRPFARAIAEEMGGAGGTYTIVVPVEIDGREVARSTATFTRVELRRLDRIDSRKAGVAW
jgi:hypothetical protein